MAARNNKDRLGVPTSGADAADSPAPATNLLDFVVPTEFVELPSK
jgi:hypothetical protein